MTIRVDRTVAIARARRLASRVSLCAVLCTSLSALSACGQMPGGASTASAGPQTPYTGLQKEAYGPLTTTPVVYCDPAANMRLAPGSGTTTSDVATDITALIAKPFGAINTIDDGIAQENLQHNFAIPGDVGQANVALIESTDDVVAFWYTQLVKLPEVQAAATEYCGRRNRTAVYAGSASRCPDTGGGQPAQDEPPAAHRPEHLRDLILQLYAGTGGLLEVDGHGNAQAQLTPDRA